jgi:hypothetical protein
MRPARSRPCVAVAIAVLLLGDRVSADGAQRLMIERSRITRLEVSAGRRSRGHKAAYGAVIGLAVGLAFTAVVAANEDCSGYGAEDCGLAPALSLVVLTPLVTVAGAGIGAALEPSERWVEVPPRAKPAGGSARFGLRLAVRF